MVVQDAARTYAVSGAEDLCNGPMRSGRSSGRRDRKALDEWRSEHRIGILDGWF